MGGSLRNPASFCGVVGMRPSPGRVAASVYAKIDGTLGAEGPMPRNVEDMALLFDAMVGANPADPLSLPREDISYLAAASPRSRAPRCREERCSNASASSSNATT
jgi:amidase